MQIEHRTPFILGINGSPFKESNTQRLLGIAVDAAAEWGAETQIIHLVDHIKIFHDGRRNADLPVELEPLFEIVSKADGLILASPTHWFSPSSLMMTFIQWMTALDYRDFSLQGKVAAAVAVCEEDGGQKVINDMLTPLVHGGFVIPPLGMLFWNKNSSGKSEDNWQETDQPIIGQRVLAMVMALRRGVPEGFSWDKPSKFW